MSSPGMPWLTRWKSPAISAATFTWATNFARARASNDDDAERLMIGMLMASPPLLLREDTCRAPRRRPLSRPLSRSPPPPLYCHEPLHRRRPRRRAGVGARAGAPSPRTCRERAQSYRP
jgi:hypothetical protein